MLDFVGLVTRHAYQTTDEDVENLRTHGWTDPQVAECVYVTALFAFFNRVADAFGLADPGFLADPLPRPDLTASWLPGKLDLIEGGNPPCPKS